jgi:hypothetical protein
VSFVEVPIIQSTRVKLKAIKEMWQTASIVARGLVCLRSHLETMVDVGGHFRDAVSQTGWVKAPSVAMSQASTKRTPWKYEGRLGSIYSGERYPTRGRLSKKKINIRSRSMPPIGP